MQVPKGFYYCDQTMTSGSDRLMISGVLFEHTLSSYSYQCFGPGSGSGRIHIIWPDPDPLQKTLIRIRVAKKNLIN